MSQQKQILNLLSQGEWVCTNSFYACYIADPRKRICELKEQGYNLEWRWCQQHNHKKSKEWRLNGMVQSQDEASRPIIQSVYTPERPTIVPVQLPMFSRNAG